MPFTHSSPPPFLIVFTQQALGAGRLVPFFSVLQWKSQSGEFVTFNPQHVFLLLFFFLFEALIDHDLTGDLRFDWLKPPRRAAERALGVFGCFSFF